MSTKWKSQGAWVLIKWKAGAPQNAWKAWEGNKSLKAGWTTSGEWDCSLLIPSKDPEAIEKFVWNHIRKNKWVEDTKTIWGWQWS